MIEKLNSHLQPELNSTPSSQAPTSSRSPRSNYSTSPPVFQSVQRSFNTQYHHLFHIMSDSIEIAKRRYSEELAAYTLEQWRLARSTLESSGSNSDSVADSDGSPSPTEERRSSRSAKTQTQVDECTRALRSVDFASKPQKAPLVSGAA